MRLIFAGTPEFARIALAALHAAGHTIALVLTQPDRAAGRGLKLQPSAVKQFAVAHELPIAQPRGLRLDGRNAEDAAAAWAAIQAVQAEVMVVAAYGLILPQHVLDAPERGCLNIHASLLPRWRGAAPIHRAVEAGDSETGIAIMQMDAGLDTGDVLLEQKLPILPTDTAGSLHDQLAACGGALIVQALAELGVLVPRPQPAAGITYATKIDKREAAVDWSQGAAQIERRIRAFDPQPGAATQLGEVPLKLWRARVGLGDPTSHDIAQGILPGTVLSADAHGICVACGAASAHTQPSVLCITELQRSGGKRLAAADFLRGVAIEPGAMLGLLQPLSSNDDPA